MSSDSSNPSSSVPINQSSITAPTPQNTPLVSAPILTHLSRPTVPDIPEDTGDDADEVDIDTTGASGLNSAILNMVQGKLNHLVGKSSGYIESLPIPVRRRIEALKGVQAEFAKIEIQQKREIFELDRKYLALYTPIFQRRQAIIAGQSEPTPEEFAAGQEQSKKDDPETEPLPEVKAGEASPEKGIPEFWLTTLKNHVGICELITERDEGALRHLTDITLEYLQLPTPGFKLNFHFSPNEYFEDTLLTKQYLYQDEIGYGGDFVYEKAIGTTIKWKEDKDLTKQVEIKRQRNKNTNRTRVIRRTLPTDSFFNFFSPPNLPNREAIEDGDIDDAELEELEERLELDYQIGEDLKERIIPRAIDYFTGKALAYEGVDVESDDDDYEDEDDDDFDDSEDDDDVPAPRRSKPTKENVDPQECKQQ